jgi:hypothetical protein
MLIPIVLTGVMAWKTKDVDEAYSESSWIFTLILVQIELACIGVPVIAILRTVSTAGRYVGVLVILWIFPMTTLTLIMLPKVAAYRRAIRGTEIGYKRGTRADGRVSGVSLTSAQMQPSRQGLESHSNAPGPKQQSRHSSAEFVASNDAPELMTHSKESQVPVDSSPAPSPLSVQHLNESEPSRQDEAITEKFETK